MRFVLALLAVGLCVGCARRSEVRDQREKMGQLQQRFLEEQKKSTQRATQMEAEALALQNELAALKVERAGLESRLETATDALAAKAEELALCQTRFQEQVTRAAAEQKKREEVLRQMREAAQPAAPAGEPAP